MKSTGIGALAVCDATADPAGSSELLVTVKGSALRLLAGREHSRTELRNKLLLRDFPANVVENVLDNLAGRGLQSDDRFAESYTRMRVNRGYGSRKIRAELVSRDVAGNIIDHALQNTEACWVENAAGLLSKKYANGSASVNNPRERAKMHRFLWSRGYNSDQIKQAINRLGEK